MKTQDECEHDFYTSVDMEPCEADGDTDSVCDDCGIYMDHLGYYKEGKE